MFLTSRHEIGLHCDRQSMKGEWKINIVLKSLQTTTTTTKKEQAALFNKRYFSLLYSTSNHINFNKSRIELLDSMVTFKLLENYWRYYIALFGVSVCNCMIEYLTNAFWTLKNLLFIRVNILEVNEEKYLLSFHVPISYLSVFFLSSLYI